MNVLSLRRRHQPRRARRLVAGAAALACSAAGLAVGAGSAEASGSRLPTPTVIVVRDVTAHSFSLNIGGATTKQYSVFYDLVVTQFGSFYDKIVSGGSSSSLKIVMGGLPSNSSFQFQVQQYDRNGFSELSKTFTVRTAVAPATAPVTNLRVPTITSQSAAVAWTASATPSVIYDVYLNGLLNVTTSSTSATVSQLLSYPNVVPGTEIRPGQINRIGVIARTSLAPAPGDPSSLVEISVLAPPA